MTHIDPSMSLNSQLLSLFWNCYSNPKVYNLSLSSLAVKQSFKLSTLSVAAKPWNFRIKVFPSWHIYSFLLSINYSFPSQFSLFHLIVDTLVKVALLGIRKTVLYQVYYLWASEKSPLSKFSWFQVLGMEFEFSCNSIFNNNWNKLVELLNLGRVIV